MIRLEYSKELLVLQALGSKFSSMIYDYSISGELDIFLVPGIASF